MNQSAFTALVTDSERLQSLAWPLKTTSSRGETILVAEDNPDLLEVMGIFLALMGYTPVACCDGEVASAMYKMNRSFALLITDLEMLGKSGLELARELTALQHGLSVIIVSGAMITDEMWLEMRARNWLFLAKPYVLPVLLASVQSLIRESAVTRKEPKLDPFHTICVQDAP